MAENKDIWVNLLDVDDDWLFLPGVAKIPPHHNILDFITTYPLIYLPDHKELGQINYVVWKN